jgi:hypothetical protein
MQTGHPVDQLCAALHVSRSASAYHAWAERRPGPRAQASALLLPLIEQAHQESRQTYGSPRVHRWLQRRGRACGRHRIARLMRAAGLRNQSPRRFRPVSLTDSQHDLPIAPHRLREVTMLSRRDAVWVADIIYVPTAEAGYMWLAFWIAARAAQRLGEGEHAGHRAALGRFGGPCNIASRRRAWCIIPIAASNTPLKVIGNDWRWRALFRA